MVSLSLANVCTLAKAIRFLIENIGDMGFCHGSTFC